MKRIILVDDEPIARQHVRESFPWTDWGYEIVGEAGNGAEALELCGGLKPDMALIDITMPVMDGLTLLDHMAASFPDTKCIILTAHRDFSYAQRAVQKGAFGYILKSPIDLAETKAALERASMELEKERRWVVALDRERRLVESSRYPLRRHFFQQLLTSVLTQDQEIMQRSSGIGITLTADHFLMLVCQADPLPLFVAKYPENDQSLVEYSMLEIVRESLLPLLPGQFEILPAFFGRFVILITFNGPVTTRDHYRQVCRQIEKRLEEPLSNYLKLQLAIAASPPFSELHKLKAVYQKTARQMIYRFYYERPRIIHAEDCFPLQPLSREDAVWLNGLAAQTASDPNPKTLQRFLNKAKTFFLQMKQQPGDVTDWLTELKTIFVNDSHLPPWPDFREAGSLFDAILRLDGWFQRMLRIQSSKLSIRPEIARAMQYIHLHLQDELSLDTIAQEVELSPSHLGHLFKKEVGTSVIDYVLEQRIELAKRYLEEARFRNYELAEKVGFRHYSYFSTMFKKMTGMGPNEYRRSVKTSILPLAYEKEKG